ncbi:hypothetical protein TrLO_g2527 [Triparma laevis f. longispina]|uniref:Succinate-semialdehyde dehydrogenase, mitochondrial n=1 Tax=Triparma laevis f. longispina TaxID=1714387 RepID=A0A9W6ZG39_9STRA|nr:hypothetical protein TrLO_g2527 [Triparma laevis f. longispina]
MSESEVLERLDETVAAWDNGFGIWPQMTTSDRIAKIELVVEKLLEKRQVMIDVLMLEIGKNYVDAASEIDRTITFIRQSITLLKSSTPQKKTYGTTITYTSLLPIGIILSLGPSNYPLNETYAMILPALLTGNTVIMKIPAVGGLVHLLTIDIFNSILPKGTLSFISGGGRVTCPPIMLTGKIDGLAFIGSSKAADSLIKTHPEPHRLKVFSQLEAKNMGIFFADGIEEGLNEAVKGSFSYNGQRCTALKILWVPRGGREVFERLFKEKVEGLKVGLPWDGMDVNEPSDITPLPPGRVEYMKELIDDAQSKGANIYGGEIVGGSESRLMKPAVVFGVEEEMRLWEEEQFGPIAVVKYYEDLEEVLEYGKVGKYAQQVSIFTKEGKGVEELTDKFRNIFGKININVAAGRSPDELAFSGRRSSAMGTMSVRHALEAFTTETVLATKEGKGEEIFERVLKESKFGEAVV